MPTQTPVAVPVLEFIIDRTRLTFTADPERGWIQESPDGDSQPSDLITVLEAAGTVASAAGERAMRRHQDNRVGRASYKDAYRRNDRSDEVLTAHMAALRESVAQGHAETAAALAEQVTETFDLLDYADIGAMCGFSHKTAINYNSRGVLPPAILYKGGSPLWARRQIREWVPNRRGLDWRKGQTGPAKQ